MNEERAKSLQEILEKKSLAGWPKEAFDKPKGLTTEINVLLPDTTVKTLKFVDGRLVE